MVSVFFFLSFFVVATISSLRSTIAEQSRNYLEVSYKDVPSFHDRTITYLRLDSRVHHLALLHFGCGCMVQSYIDSQEWPGNQVQSLWRRWGYAQVLQTRAIGAEEHRRKWHKQKVQADKYSQRWIA